MTLPEFPLRHFEMSKYITIVFSHVVLTVYLLSL